MSTLPGGATMGLNSNYNTLINRGRKAGLNTRELYSAIAAQNGEGEAAPGQSDTNGYVSSIDSQGRRVYRPLGPSPR